MERGVADDQVHARIGQGRHRVVAKDLDAFGQSVCGHGGGGRCHGSRRPVGREHVQLRAGPGESRGNDGGATAEVHGSAGSRVHAVKELQKKSRAEIELGPGERPAMGTDPQVEVRVVLAQRVCRCAGFRCRPSAAGHQDTGLLLRQRCPHLGEAVAEHLVHGAGHVLDAAAEEHQDVGVGVGRNQLGDLPQFIEALRELTEDDGGPGKELWSHRELPEPVAQPDPNRVVRQGLFTGDEVLMDSNVLRIVQRHSAERHGAIAVSDDDDPPGGCCLDRSAGLGQDQSIGRVDSHEVVGLEVGEASQELEVDRVVHRGQPATASNRLSRECRRLSLAGERPSGRGPDPGAPGRPDRSCRWGRGCSSRRGSCGGTAGGSPRRSRRGRPPQPTASQ